jgi:transposase InsO family protein
MPGKYEAVITALETISSSISLEFVKGRLLDAELKFKNCQLEPENKSDCSFGAFSYQNRGCFECGDPHHHKSRCPNLRSQQSNFRRRRRGGRRYVGRNSGGYYRGAHGYNHPASANVTTQDDETTFVAHTVGLLAGEHDNDLKFVLDSGATEHLVRETLLPLMANIENLSRPVRIQIANGDKLTAEKRGKLRVRTSEGFTVNLTALIVKNLSLNILSVRKISNTGKDVVFKKDRAVIHDKTGFNMECNLIENLYLANFIQCKEENCEMSIKVKDLWHKRLGHINRRGLKMMNLPYSEEVCSPCMRGKATRLPFKPVQHPRSSRIGELLHSDVGGPVNPPTANGERFYQTVMDDFSHFCVVFLLKSKSEASQNLMNFIQQLKTVRGKYVNKIKCDNGGEYTSNELKDFCTKKGIRLEYTLHYSPQMNGKAERLNRTLQDKVRTLLAETNLPKTLWGEAIRCAAYQLNRSPTNALNGQIPAKIYLGRLDIEKLRIFGSKAWAYKLPKCDKLETRAREVRMVGYHPCGYRLWDPVTNEIVVSRDVRFNESNIFFKGQEKENESTICEDKSHEKEQSVESEIEDKEEENLYREKERRQIRKPKRFEDYELYTTYCLCAHDPKTYDEAVEMGQEWRDAIHNELDAHEKYNTWTPAVLPKGKTIIDTRWVFKTKADGVKKARLVARGFQEEELYNVYSPVARMPTIRMMLAKAVQEKWSIKQLDVPTAFLNGELNVEVYIKPPQGVSTNVEVFKLNKALYGLREAPKCWNQRFDDFAVSNGLDRSRNDFCLYTGKDIWLLIFVDDILVAGKYEKVVERLKKEFNAKDLGVPRHFLGTVLVCEGDTISISQESFIEKILGRFRMEDCKGANTPMEPHFQIDSSEEIVDVPYRELIGSLMYISMISRPDITYATSYLSRFLDRPTNQLWKAGKRVLRYLKMTKELALTYTRNSALEEINAYADADWAADKSDRKSVSGSAIFYGGKLIQWTSKKQQTVALSTAEAEYIAAASTASEMIYVRGVASDLSRGREVPAHLLVDNQSAISLIESYENSKRSKHIDIKAHFIKDLVSKKVINIKYIPTDDNVADIFTKPLSLGKFSVLRNCLCLY